MPPYNFLKLKGSKDKKDIKVTGVKNIIGTKLNHIIPIEKMA